MAEEDLSVVGEDALFSFSFEEGLAGLFFQSFHLHADGGLGEVDFFGGFVEAVDVGDGKECPEDVEAEVFHTSIILNCSIKYMNLREVFAGVVLGSKTS